MTTRTITITIEHDAEGYPCAARSSSSFTFRDMVSAARVVASALEAAVVTDVKNHRSVVAEMAARVDRLGKAVTEVEAACGMTSSDGHLVIDGISLHSGGRA